MRALLGRASAWVRCRPLAFALWVGLTLRLLRIQGRELQYDDAFSIFLSARSLPEIVTGTAADTMPPLYYFLLHFWMLVSREVWFIRLLSVLFSLAAIVLLFWTVKRWLGQAAAGWAAFLAAISPLQIYHAQDIRMYALLVLGQMGYLWFCTRILFGEQEGRVSRWDWAGMVLCGLAAMYSHNLAIFVMAVPDLLLVYQRRWNLLFRLVGAQLVIGLGALPWLLLLPGQLAKIQQAFWTPRPGPVEIIQAVIMFTAALPLPPALLVVAAVLAFQILILLGLETWRAGRSEPGMGFLLLWLLLPPVMLFIISYLMRPVFVPRGFLVASLAYFALAGFVIDRSWKRGPGKLVAGAFVLAAVVSLPNFYLFNGFPRPPIREATAWLEKTAAPGAAIIHETKLSYFPAHFYAPDFPQVFLADEPGSANDTFAPASQEAMQIFPAADLPAAVGDSRSIYFITFSQVFAEYRDSGIGEHPRIAWLNQHYRFVERRVFNDLEIYFYER